MADTASLKKLKVTELREELTLKGLSSKGNKQELIERLTEHVEGNDSALDNEAETENRAPMEAITTEEEADLLDTGIEAITAAEEAAILDAEPKDDSTVTETTDDDPGPPKLTPITPPQVKETVTDRGKLTEIEKKKSRAERFSAPLSEDAKKAARAQRFGTPVTPKETATDEAKKMPKTGGLISSIPQVASTADVDKLKKRAARFGAVVSPVVAKSEQQARLLKRKERFGGTETKTSVTSGGEVDTKKQKRAERFGL